MTACAMRRRLSAWLESENDNPRDHTRVGGPDGLPVVRAAGSRGRHMPNFLVICGDDIGIRNISA